MYTSIVRINALVSYVDALIFLLHQALLTVRDCLFLSLFDIAKDRQRQVEDSDKNRSLPRAMTPTHQRPTDGRFESLLLGRRLSSGEFNQKSVVGSQGKERNTTLKKKSDKKMIIITLGRGICATSGQWTNF